MERRRRCLSIVVVNGYYFFDIFVGATAMKDTSHVLGSVVLCNYVYSQCVCIC